MIAIAFLLPFAVLLLAAAWITRPDWLVPWALCQVLGHRRKWSYTYGHRGAWLCTRCGVGL